MAKAPNQAAPVQSGTKLPSLRSSPRCATSTSAKAAAEPANDPNAVTAIHDYFDGIDATLRHIEEETKASEPKHLQGLVRFAARAYRRPLTRAESEDLLAYYRTLRSKNQLSHADAVRETIVSILMSPDFLYRVDLQSSAAGALRNPALRNVAMKS